MQSNPACAGRRASVTAAVAAILVIAANAAPTATLAGTDDIANLPLRFGHSGLFNDPRNDGRQGPRGTWRVNGGELVGGELVLRFEIEPPDVNLEVESGPAVLFGGFQLLGDAGGDVGASRWVGGSSTTLLRACDDAACRFAGEVRLPTEGIGESIDAFTSGQLAPTLDFVSAEFTLVRTFARGTWIQVLPFLGVEGEKATGTVRTPPPGIGSLFPFGLFPAALASPVLGDAPLSLVGESYRGLVEELRSTAFDPSRPLEMAPAFVQADLGPTCGGSTLTVHTMNGDFVWTADRYLVTEVRDGFAIPTNVAFTLTLHDGGGIDFDQRSGWGIRGGDIVSTGGPILVDARFRCSDRTTGDVEVSTSALVAPSGAAPGATHSRSPAPTSMAPTAAPTPPLPTAVAVTAPMAMPDPGPWPSAALAAAAAAAALGAIGAGLLMRRRAGR